MRIVLHTRASRELVRQTEQAFGPGVVRVVDSEDRAGFAEAARTMEVLLHVLTPANKALLDESPGLKLIQKIGVGVNTIDLDAAKARGIAVCNMPGTNSQAVAEQALALMLAVLRRVPALDALTKAGNGWHADSELLDSTGEICGRTVGLLGLGSSAQRLARALEGLGANILYTARHDRPELPYARVSLQELLERSDILSLHVPLTEDTRHIINEPALSRLPKGAILINTARGGLVDESALQQALESGHLRGAGLDVFAKEPVPVDHPLLALPQVVTSPHTSWLTPETLHRSMVVAAENSRRIQTGEPLLHRVV